MCTCNNRHPLIIWYKKVHLDNHGRNDSDQVRHSSLCFQIIFTRLWLTFNVLFLSTRQKSSDSCSNFIFHKIQSHTLNTEEGGLVTAGIDYCLLWFGNTYEGTSSNYSFFYYQLSIIKCTHRAQYPKIFYELSQATILCS